jgi:SSS family solute:Na+ symporter
LLNLVAIDWVIIAVFVVALFYLALSAKLRNSTVLQYLVAGRALTLPIFVATLVSTWYGGVLGIGESVSFFGLGTLVLMGVPFYVFGLLYAIFLAKKVRQDSQLSIPERIHSQFGKSAGVLAAILIFLLAVPAAHVLMLGTMISLLTNLPLVTCILVAAVVGVVLLFRGGLVSDARISLLAFISMYLGFLIIVIFCLVRYPIVETWSTLDNSSLFTWDGGMGVPFVISFFFLGAWTMVDPAFHQRAASAINPKTAQRGIFISVGFWMLFDVLMVTTGMYALSTMAEPPAGLNLFPVFGAEVLPPGLRAVFLCGLIGVVVSAMVGYTLVSGSTVGREIIARLKGNEADEGGTFWVRTGLIVAIVISVLLAINIQSVVALWYAWAGISVGALFFPVLLAYLGKGLKIPPKVVLTSMGVAAISSFIWLIYARSQGNEYLSVKLWNDQEISLGTLIPGLLISGLILAPFARRNTEKER